MATTWENDAESVPAGAKVHESNSNCSCSGLCRCLCMCLRLLLYTHRTALHLPGSWPAAAPAILSIVCSFSCWQVQRTLNLSNQQLPSPVGPLQRQMDLHPHHLPRNGSASTLKILWPVCSISDRSLVFFLRERERVPLICHADFARVHMWDPKTPDPICLRAPFGLFFKEVLNHLSC